MMAAQPWDVSALDFEDFVRFFFARPPLAFGEPFTDGFCRNGTPIRLADPRRVVMHLGAMCTAFRAGRVRYVGPAFTAKADVRTVGPEMSGTPQSECRTLGLPLTLEFTRKRCNSPRKRGVGEHTLEMPSRLAR
jgi:hypothetical protein